MANKSVLVRIPASVGSFGGFAGCALALEAALNVKVTARADGRTGIRYFGPSGQMVARDRSNLAVRGIEAALGFRSREFTGADLEVYSSIPVGVGLGSSTASLLAGLLAADRLFKLQLHEKEILELGAIYEMRTDNLGAAWLGGLVTCRPGQPPTYQQTTVQAHLVLNVVVPEPCMAGWQSLSSPPENLQDLVEDVPPASLQRLAALARLLGGQVKENTTEFGHAVSTKPAKQAPGLEEALQIRVSGLLSVFVCGFGPAVGILAEGDSSAAVTAAQTCFARHGVPSYAAHFRASNAGASEWNAVRVEAGPPRATAPGYGARSTPVAPA